MKALFINMFIAIVWVLVFWEFTLWQFALGFIVGFIALSIYSMLRPPLNYTRRGWGLLRFIPIFINAFVKANLEVAAVILFLPKSKLTPSTFSYDISHLSNFESLLLSHIISLTPGTITVDICQNTSSILVHCLHYKDPVQTEQEITNHFKNSILRFTR